MMRSLILFKLTSIFFIFTISADVRSQDNTVKFAAPIDKTFFILPIPNNKIPLHSKISIHAEGKSLEHKSRAVTLWYNHNQNKFIRLLVIKVEHSDDHKNTKIINYKLKWSPANQSINLKEFHMKSPPFLVFPSNQWLAQSILLHPELSFSDAAWYTEPQSLYANFVTNETLLNKNHYPKEKYSQWLFDRPRAIFQLFILSGNNRWLTEGKKLTEFYLNHLDDSGKFLLKKQFDLKYLMPNGLLYFHLLTGDNRITNILKIFFEQSLNWSSTYDDNNQFWTERHQAAALNIAIAYWEISGNPKAKERIDEIVEATVQMVFNPRNDWPLRGCPQHTYKSHEGKAGDFPVCSPWMMALLGDSLWRYYRLSNDKKSAALLNAFGDFMPNFGIHFADERLKNMVLPLYLASMDNKLMEIKDQWTDRQHACDVASLIGKSLYIKKKKIEDTFLLQELFNVFVQQCKDINKKYQNKRHDYLPMLPPRRFGWTYSTTSDLPWLESWLNSHDTK